MLHYIKIKNLALIDTVELEFDPGFIAITGETGAGKSVLLGALALLAGNRVDKAVIRQGAETCEVEGSLFFEDTALIDAQLESMGLPVSEEGAVILRRSVLRQKSGRVYINGALATVAALRELGESWIDFHGPGEPQKLFKESFQLAMLDLFARNQESLGTYNELYEQWKTLLQQAESLKQGERLSADEITFIQTQIEQIDQLELSAERIDVLERDFNRLDKAQDLVQAAGQLQEGLLGDTGVLPQLTALARWSEQLVEIASDASVLNHRLKSLIIETEDLASEYGRYTEGTEISEDTAKLIQESMQQWL